MTPKQMTETRLDLEAAGLADIRAAANECLLMLANLANAQVRQGLSHAPSVAHDLRNALADAVADHWEPEMADIRNEIETREGAL